MQLKSNEQRKAKSKIRQLKNQLRTLSNTAVTGDHNRVLELAQAIIDSTEPSLIYPPNIGYTILLAFLFKKAMSKKEILIYYRTLQKKLGIHIFKDSSILETQKWFNAQFNQSDFLSIQQQLSLMEKYTPSKFVNMLLRDEMYEKFLFAQITDRFYRGTYPKKPEYANVQFKNIIYPDCTETTVRFLCNTLFYNSEKGIFEIPNDKIKKIERDLISFYQDNINKQVIFVDLPEVHQKWSKLLVNRPLITYKRILYRSDNGSIITLSSPDEVDGFIRISPEISQKAIHDKNNQKTIIIDNHKYILVEDENVQLFTVAASLKNIIILLDQLLGLKLISTKDFLKSNFNQIYFPKISTFIKPLNKIKLPPHKCKQLDKKDLSKEGIRLKGKNVELTLLYNHAELTLHESCKQYPYIPIIINRLIKEKSENLQSLLFNLSAIIVHSQDQFTNSLQLLFAFNLQNDNEKIKILKQFTESTAFKQSNKIIRDKIDITIAKIMQSLPLRLDWLYQRECIDSVNPKIFKHPIIFPIIENWKKIGLKRLYNENLEPDSVPLLFASFIRTGLFYDESRKIIYDSLNKIIPKLTNTETKKLFQKNVEKLCSEIKKYKTLHI